MHLHLRKALPLACLIVLSPPASLPSSQTVAADDAQDTRRDLMRYARDTWRGFEALERPGGLPADSLTVARDGSWTLAGYTSPTDVAAYLWSILAAESLHLIDADEAGKRLGRTLDALGHLDRSHGFFYNWYDAGSGARLATWPVGGHAARPFLSSVDNGWLAAAFIMVGNARPELRTRAEALLAPMDFGFFYDPFNPADPDAHPGNLVLGYWTDDDTYTRYHYGLMNTEPRIATYVGIARNQLPAEHYYRLKRTIPSRLGGREPAPEGETRTYAGVPVFEGHTTYRGARIVPSWGGSMFEALMVPLFVPEDRWAPGSWGLNHPLYARAQVEYGLNEANYGFWGFSPSESPHGGYREYGVAPLSTKPIGYPSGDLAGSGEPARGPSAPLHGVVTPHASFLALPFLPNEAMLNLRTLERKFPAYGPFGFYDSVDVSSGKVADGVLALDQGMILAAIANHLADDILRRHLCDGQIEQVIRPLIAQEQFTAAYPTSASSTSSTSAEPPALVPAGGVTRDQAQAGLPAIASNRTAGRSRPRRACRTGRQRVAEGPSLA